MLPESEFLKLDIAHNHFLLGEGAGELYEVCNDLLSKYQDPFASAVTNFKTEFLKALKIPQIVEWLSKKLPKSQNS